MYKRINKLINTNQFGFRANQHEHALISLIETIKHDLDSGLYICGIFVEHLTCMIIKFFRQQLSFYGIRGLENIWSCSFLTQRKQFVSISVFLSDTRIIQCGVPQGSTLGPLLFFCPLMI